MAYLVPSYAYYHGFFVHTVLPQGWKVEKVEGDQALRYLYYFLLGRASLTPEQALGRHNLNLAQLTPSSFYSEGPVAQNMELLGAAFCLVACATVGPVTLPPKGTHFGFAVITGYSGGDIASLRFNGDAGANYWDQHFSALGTCTSPCALTRTTTVSTTLCRLAATALTTGRWVAWNGRAGATNTKAFNIQTVDVTGAAATAGKLDIGECEWVNTTDALTDIRIVAAGGANLNAGTIFGVFGK